MSYVEGFVAAVPRANKDAYRNHAAGAVAMFKEFGPNEVRSFRPSTGILMRGR